MHNVHPLHHHRDTADLQTGHIKGGDAGMFSTPRWPNCNCRNYGCFSVEASPKPPTCCICSVTS